MNKYFVNNIGIYADDDRFIREVLIENEYQYLFGYDTVVDLGSNIGTFSLWIYPHAKRIYAVEPNPKPIELLRKTIEDNKLDKITPVEIAITGTNGVRLLANTDDTAYGSGLINDTVGMRIKSMQLDTFMVEYKIEYIDLLKIDIELTEKELFESAGFRNVQNKIGTIIGEYHNGSIQESIKASLTGAGFKYVDLTRANSSGKFIARRL